MSCYFSYLKDVFDEAGIEVTPANKRQVDQAIHRIMGIDYKECPATWQKFKSEVLSNQQKRRDFVQKLRSALSN